MEHAEALEHIEIAAAEPGGLDRLMAGDTPEAALVAGHLAGCQACAAELVRIRRSAMVAREAIRAQPDPALRERTLAFVRAVGRERSSLPAGVEPGPDIARAETERAGTSGVRRRPSPAWIAAIAAALIVATGLGLVGGRMLQGVAPDRGSEVGWLQDATQAAMRIAAQDDARQVTLAATSLGGSAAGSLVFSPATGELVVVATNLAPVAAGQEYGCWVETGGQRVRLGRMYHAGDIWTWAGSAPDLGSLPPGTVFGVSVGPAGGGDSASPMLTGSL